MHGKWKIHSWVHTTRCNCISCKTFGRNIELNMGMLLNQFLSKLNHLRSFPQFFEEKKCISIAQYFSGIWQGWMWFVAMCIEGMSVSFMLDEKDLHFLIFLCLKTIHAFAFMDIFGCNWFLVNCNSNRKIKFSGINPNGIHKKIKLHNILKIRETIRIYREKTISTRNNYQ